MAAPRTETTVIVTMIVVFIVVAIWMYYTFSKPGDYHPPRSTMSTKGNGCMAVYELLEQLGQPVERYGGNEYHYPEDGCMVLVDPSFADAATMMVGLLNMKQVAGWVQGGGRLVIASEAESMTMGYNLFEELDGRSSSSLFDFDPQMHTNTGDDGLAYPNRATADFSGDGKEGRSTAMLREYNAGQQYRLPDDRPLFWEDVDTFEIAKNDYYWGAEGTVLLANTPPDAPVIVYRKAGAGEVYWVTCPELLTNDWIDRADNHRVVLALLDHAADGGTVYFDEHIHGFRNEGYNAGSLITKTRGGQLILLFGVALMLVFAGGAIRPAKFHPRPTPPRRQASEMVLAQADLYRRARLKEHIARLLIDGLKRQYMQAAHIATPPSDERLAEILEAAGQTRSPAGQFLKSYLAGGVLPANANDLLKIARACFAAQGKL